ncbi:MAG: carbohydrate porin [Deltaproteobacteria bacterium]|nr:carbohydrate porin [Deltaproteobacteria bacterium]
MPLRTRAAKRSSPLCISLTLVALLAGGTAQAQSSVPPSSYPASAPTAPAKALAEKAQAEPPKAAAKPATKAPSRRDKLLDGLMFGSYGRINLSGDLSQGSRGRSVNIVSRGPRLEEGAYGEINLGYRYRRDEGMSFLFLFTLALLDDVFHYDGEVDSKLAIRNFYLQVDNVLGPYLSLWAGSRMYRGDDIYLLDFWPLDDLNTLGAGASLCLGKTSLDLHGGVTRLDDPYHYQVMEVPTTKLTTREVEVLDRQHVVLSAKLKHEIHDLTSWLSMKLIAYGEAHFLPDGTRRADFDVEGLPADFGWVAGAQVGVWGFGPGNYANLFFRAAGGLGAYDELEVPHGLGPDKKSTDASEVRVGLSAYYGGGMVGALAGGYLRYFRDADGIASDFDDGWEYVMAVRPMLYLTRHFHQLFELSVQGARADGLHPEEQRHLSPHVYKFSLMPALTWDKGPYARPQLRLVYTYSYLDGAARKMFAPQDVRYGKSSHHYLGVQVEWWYNSSYR